MSEPKPKYQHGGKRKGAGRPPLDAERGGATKELTIRLDKNQHTYTTLAAGRENIPLAAYIRRLIKQDIARNQPLTRLTEEQTQYLKEHYGGIVAGITALIEKDKGETF